MAQSEILFHDIPDSGNGFVAGYFIFRKFSAGCCFTHDAIFNFIHGKKLAIGFSNIPLIREHLLNGFFRMTTAGDTKRKIRTVMMRSRRHLRGQDKTLFDIHRSMFFESEVRNFIFHRPVRFQIAGELERLAILIDLAIRRLSFQLFFFQFFRFKWMGSGLNQAGVNGNALVDRQSLGGKL